MAKLTGPLMSLDARGGFGGALVFSGWKGRSTVRQLVKPANPMSTGQVTARNIQRVTAAAQKFANACLLHGAGRTKTDKALLIAAAPAGQAWNGNLVFGMTGAGALVYQAATTAYNALLAGDKTAWDVAAAALVPVIGQVAQYTAGNVPAAAMPGGEVFFHYQYGLYSLGIAAIPAAVPPVYA